MERVPRELFVPEPAPRPRLRRRGAADRRRADDLAAVHGRPDLRGARAARGASACSTSARARATRPRSSPSSQPRCTRSSGSTALAEPRPRGACRRGLRARARPRRRRHARRCPSTRRSRAIAVAAAAPDVPASLYAQLEPGGRLVDPRRRPQRTGAPARRPQPRGPRRAALGAVPVRPARRRGGLRGRVNSANSRYPRLVARSTAAGITATRAGRALARPQNWVELRQVLARRCERVRRQPRRLHRPSEGRRPPLPAGRRLLVRRRRHEQLLLEPALDLPRTSRGNLYYQGMRFFVVSAGRARAQPRCCCRCSSRSASDKIAAQAIAIILVTPFSFSVNKLWSFRR